jgi:hypothetical protein
MPAMQRTFWIFWSAAIWSISLAGLAAVKF